MRKLRREKHLAAISIQVTGDCNMACTYCYQTHKNSMKVDIDKAKYFIDKIVENNQEYWNGYIDFTTFDGICLDFVGGEPLVNYKAVIELGDYFKEKCMSCNNACLYCNSSINVSTNGTIYNQEIEDFIVRHNGKVRVAITIDGDKELHDSCRVFKGSGLPSYDIVVENLHKFRKICGVNNTKVTISPENIDFMSSSIKNLYETLGFDIIHSNCVYEDVWQPGDGLRLYTQLKSIADYLLEVFQPEDSKEYSFFNEHFFKQETNLNRSWCGGNGKMLFLQYDGKIFNCIRFADTATGEDKSYCIGYADNGMTETDKIAELKSVNKDKTYDDECRACPISEGCSDCTAYNYQYYGDLNHRLKSLCEMHKARSLANAYFWNKFYIKNCIDKVFLINLGVEEALKIVSEDEFNLLLDLSNNRYILSLEECENETLCT